MSSTLIAVSLKMYFDLEGALRWAHTVKDKVACHSGLTEGRVDLVVLPDLVALHETAQIFDGTPIRVGAQDLSWADAGPYTGDVSGVTIRQAGCTLAEIGHAERTLHHNEDAHRAGDKLAAALRNDLQPLICVGEQTQGDPRDAAEQCLEQWNRIWDRVPSAESERAAILRPILAYEPQWSIGAALPATPDHISAVVDTLRSTGNLPTGTQIVYGGTAGPELIPQLSHAVDGLFLGRRAHDPETLLDVINAASHLTEPTPN